MELEAWASLSSDFDAVDLSDFGGLVGLANGFGANPPNGPSNLSPPRKMI